MVVDETGDGTADRRTYLKALGTIGAAGLAGCASDGGGNGGGGSGSGGGGSTSTEWSYDGEIDQAFVSPDNLENDIWQTFLAGAEEAASALGLTVDYQGHGGQESQQISQLQSAIAAGADILTGTAYQNSGVRSVAETAAEGGVPFTSYWTMANWWTPMDSGPEFLQYQIPEVVRTGAATARVLFEAMGGSGNFVHITGVPGHVGSHRNAGVEQAMEDYPDIERLGGPIPSEWTRSTGRQAMSDFISQYGDDIDGVYGQNDGVALGAISVLEENDMAVPVVGYDGFRETTELIRDRSADSGEPYIAGTFAAQPFWQGGYAVVKGYDWLNGWRPEAPERMMFGGGVMILNDGLSQDTFSGLDVSFTEPSQYLDIAFSDGQSPYDWEAMSYELSGDDWDPQNLLVPIRQEDFSQLLWTEENRPSNYEVPDVYDDTELFDRVEEDYRERFENGLNPYA
ncbi:sugar ABC transporter substrate-binding protein [Haloarcula brevis]|uniref:sugar ABC transporter substrate-binding protein n=1 Tax=Haloarcula brevis TaxID=3111453 RepID=UPI00300F1929